MGGDLWGTRKNIRHEIGSIKQVFEVIEHEQHVPLAQIAEQMGSGVGLPGEREAEGIADRQSEPARRDGSPARPRRSSRPGSPVGPCGHIGIVGAPDRAQGRSSWTAAACLATSASSQSPVQ